MGKYRAGTGISDITPQVGCHITGYFNDRIATDVHDHLYAKSIAVSDGEGTVLLICLHLLGVPDYVCVKAKELICKNTGIPVQNIIISAVHTHTGPSISGLLGTPPQVTYINTLPEKILEAARASIANMRPAEIAYTSGDCTAECHNRRGRMKDGTFRMNPPKNSPDVICPAGPTDPQLGLLIIREKGTRKPIAVYANLSLHYIGNRRGTSISADYFEDYSKALQHIAGEEFMVILANGCQGNINNVDWNNPEVRVEPPEMGPYYTQWRVANIVAAETWRVWCSLNEKEFASEGKVEGRNSWVPFKARATTPEELEKAKKLYYSCDQSNFNEWIYAREFVLMQDLPQEYDILVQTMHIGSTAIAALNGEVFVEFGLDIKARSPFPHTMTVGLANGYNGYTATDQALDEGSYETRLCRHVRAPKGTGQAWADAAVASLWEMI